MPVTYNFLVNLLSSCPSPPPFFFLFKSACNFNGITYSDGDEFSPNGDPCDVCVCQDGRLRCEHNNCPGVASCPQDSIRQADPGSCCDTCIQECKISSSPSCLTVLVIEWILIHSESKDLLTMTICL